MTTACTSLTISITWITFNLLVGVTVSKDCVQIDQCKCSFDDGSGVVDLSVLGRQDGTPLIRDEFGPDNYIYSYNPCYPFTEVTCSNCAACQHDYKNFNYYNIGDPDKVRFSFDGSNVVATYVSDDGERTSVVTFVCDPAVNNTTYTVQGEITVARYGFTITSKHACPSAIVTPTTPTTLLPSSVSPSTIDPNTKPNCRRTTNCSCVFNDETGKVDVSILGRKDGTPLINNVFAPDGFGYSFNPCYPFSLEMCSNAAVCRFDSSRKTYTNIGSSTGVTFIYDGQNVVGTYKSKDGKSTTMVTYICDLHLLIPKYTVVGEVAAGIYNITVTTNGVCPSTCGATVQVNANGLSNFDIY